MKKILFLFIIIFFVSGCYDYVELNNLSIITGIGIDKVDENFKISFEIINDEKSNNESKVTSKIYEGTGKTIAEAIDNTTKSVPKLAYYAHLKVLVISSSLDKDDIPELIDYFLRSPQIRNEFYLVVAKDVTASEIFNKKAKKDSVISDEIKVMIENNRYRKNNTSPYYFEEAVQGYFNQKIDPAFTAVTLKEGNLNIDGLHIYKGYDKKGFLSDEESLLYNILNNNAKNVQFTFECGNKPVNVSVINSKVKTTVNKEKVYLNVFLEGVITEYTCDKSLKSDKVYNQLNIKYGKEINDKIIDFINLTKRKEVDLFGISDKYYLKYKKRKKSYKMNYEIKTTLKINNDGLIFEVDYDN